MGIKVALHNLGCKVNAYEVEAMQQLLEEAGYEIVPFEPGADVYLINTCTVTNIADRKSRQMLHKAKKMNPDAIVVATGCYVQTDEGKLDKEKIPLYKKYKVPLDGVPKGKWVSLYSHSSSIIVSDVFEPGTVSLFPGVYHYISFERDLMLTVNLEEDGRYYTKISAPREW